LLIASPVLAGLISRFTIVEYVSNPEVSRYFVLNVFVPRLFDLGQRYQQCGDLLSDNQN
jgi:hypothetical protein